MDLTLSCDYADDKRIIFSELDRRGVIEIDERNGTTLTVATSTAMLPEVSRVFGANGIFFSTAHRDCKDECAVECTICRTDMKNALAQHCGHVFCSDCIKDWLEKKDTCPICSALLRLPNLPEIIQMLNPLSLA